MLLVLFSIIACPFLRIDFILKNRDVFTNSVIKRLPYMRWERGIYSTLYFDNALSEGAVQRIPGLRF